ncbi:MAG: TolC family protein [Prevotellaceae bacterium]|nr:TolC family protein [Prevotellaceae bacterium]
MKKYVILLMCLLSVAATYAETLSLDSCRARALRANKQLGMARVKKKAAENARKAARTKHLPRIDVAGGYVYSSRELSILSDRQQDILSNAGTTTMHTLGDKMGPMAGQVQQEMANSIQKLAAQGVITPAQAQAFGNIASQTAASFGKMGQEMAQQLAVAGDAIGQHIVDAFTTNTHNIYTASAVLTQPLYMGGAVTAGNRMADIAERMADTGIEATEDDVRYRIDNTYWTVVALKQKQRLAEGYLKLVRKLESDVQKMIKNGVATRADGLKVSVAVNDADMTKSKVDNGLALAKMSLCQLCGMPLDSNITLEDEDKEEIAAAPVGEYDVEDAMERRHELRMLNDAIELTRQQTRIARAGHLPQVALTTGVLFSNPSVYNSFERKFKGAFNVGVMVRIPVLDWGETMYAIRAAKCATTLAQLKLSEAEELVELQISQCAFRIKESGKNLATAKKNIERAEENLRCADLGFREGVMQTTDVMAAQTAWLQAQTQKIDAEVEMKLSETALRKALSIRD